MSLRPAKTGTICLAVPAALLLLTCLSMRVDAASFADYRSRVAQAASVVHQLENPEHYDAVAVDEIVQSALTRIRQLLPATETVLLNGQHIEVDNHWLHAALDEYEKRRHPEEAAEIARQTRERLRALLKRLDEIQPGAGTDDADASKARLAEILRRPEYDNTTVQQSAFERLAEQFIKWLSKLFPKVRPLQPGTGRNLANVAQVIVIGISIALIGFLAWKFLPRYLQSRSGRKRKKKREARIVLGERLEPDQTAADLLEQAEALARAGDLRGAIRKAYIALLCELGDRKVISLAQYKTNRDYLMSVRHRPSLYASLRELTASFEIHWYGLVTPAPDDWNEFRLGCRKAVTSDK